MYRQSFENNLIKTNDYYYELKFCSLFLISIDLPMFKKCIFVVGDFSLVNVGVGYNVNFEFIP